MLKTKYKSLAHKGAMRCRDESMVSVAAEKGFDLKTISREFNDIATTVDEALDVCPLVQVDWVDQFDCLKVLRRTAPFGRTVNKHNFNEKYHRIMIYVADDTPIECFHWLYAHEARHVWQLEMTEKTGIDFIYNVKARNKLVDVMKKQDKNFSELYAIAQAGGSSAPAASEYHDIFPEEIDANIYAFTQTKMTVEKFYDKSNELFNINLGRVMWPNLLRWVKP